MKQQILIGSPFPWVRIRMQLPGYLCLKAFHQVAVRLSAGAAVSTESSTEGDPLAYTLTWTWIPLPHGLLYMAACSLQSKRSTRDEKRVFSTKAKIHFIS